MNLPLGTFWGFEASLLSLAFLFHNIESHLPNDMVMMWSENTTHNTVFVRDVLSSTLFGSPACFAPLNCALDRELHMVGVRDQRLVM